MASFSASTQKSASQKFEMRQANTLRVDQRLESGVMISALRHV
jgi:hypothetical protein